MVNKFHFARDKTAKNHIVLLCIISNAIRSKESIQVNLTIILWTNLSHYTHPMNNFLGRLLHATILKLKTKM